MVIGTLESTLVTRSMVLEFITLLMVTATRVHGMKGRNRGLECTHSVTVTQDLESGTVEF